MPMFAPFVGQADPNTESFDPNSSARACLAVNISTSHLAGLRSQAKAGASIAKAPSRAHQVESNFSHVHTQQGVLRANKYLKALTKPTGGVWWNDQQVQITCGSASLGLV